MSSSACSYLGRFLFIWGEQASLRVRCRLALYIPLRVYALTCFLKLRGLVAPAGEVMRQPASSTHGRALDFVVRVGLSVRRVEWFA
jgi:hypothetical protein